MAQGTYSEAKENLKDAAYDAKRNFPNDKPAIRQTINDTADQLIRDFPLSWSDKKRNQFAKWLHEYACTLHPKD